ADQQQEREPGDENLHQQRLALGLLRGNPYVRLAQLANERRVVGFRTLRGEVATVVKRTLNGATLEGHFRDVASFHLRKEIGIGDRLRLSAAGAEIVEHRQQQQNDNGPENQIAGCFVQGGNLAFAANSLCGSIL